ncbi:UPF0182 family protein [Leptolyngbya sp. FACHB-261]|uniref:UPF0182 family membrane protein n=1 Tax=Leptolyngbya sp. FACHB-261 TaxID=2692806 RepID=UPI0016855A13|nr:UPF0182 family protein [Leptolyngbya sp. FACHB-261]MBD2104685.1 UPF0182 family protein [Leptolyngbya sp. FACHB-261]
MFAKWSPRFKIALPLLLIVLVLLGPGVNLRVESLWFQVVGYAQVFNLRWLTQVLVSAIGLLLAGSFAGANLWWAWRYDPEAEANADLRLDSPRRRSRRLEQRVVTSVLRSSQARPAALPPDRKATALRLYGRDLSLIAAAVVALLLALDLGRNWFRLLAWWHQQPFEQVDPVFGLNLNFYVFSLPVLQALQLWSFNLVVVTLLAVALVYAYRRGALSQQDKFVGFLRSDRQHLVGLVGVLALVLAWGHWLARYELLNSERGVVFGAGYADLQASLPAQTLLAAVTLVAGLLLLGSTRNPRWVSWQSLSRVVFGYGLLSLLAGVAYPILVQRFVVQPTELAKERPYLERNIAFTQQGFGLEAITEQPFEVQFNLTRSDLAANNATISNIRLWDSRPLLDAYSQLQSIRLYYRFADVDIDRYRFSDGVRQVMLAARELDYEQVPQRAQTWVNQHFLYTHGYGLSMSPVNAVTAEGQPEFFIKDIPPVTTSPQLAERLPVQVPGIYYGELTRHPVFVRTRAQELDYPQGDDNAYTRYDGVPGLSVGSLGERLLYAWYFRDPRILLTQNFTPESQILFRRAIRERATTIAPFLRYDADPYLVLADGKLYWILDAYTTSNHYPYSEPLSLSATRALPTATPTGSDATGATQEGEDPETQALQHPEYRDPLEGLGDLNYIRNSVKVVIDAYNGTVGYYISDAKDPVIQTYAAIFPKLFQPLSALSPALGMHLRYPSSLFAAQSRLYATYHMRDPQVFYNKEDQWQIPLELLGSEPIVVPPYYLVMKLPGESREEFILMTPFTPTRKDNLIAWVAARSDGQAYGKLLAYQFSKQELIYGPRQIEARIDQDPVISQQISLWNQRGSQVYRGNLLVIPINSSLLYVEPLYLEAEQSRLPELRRVIVAYENQVVMAPTLDEALGIVFRGTTPRAQPAGNVAASPDAGGDPIPTLPSVANLPTGGNPIASDLVQQALQQWEAGQQALVQGNWTEYGRLQRELYETLRELEQQAGPTGRR